MNVEYVNASNFGPKNYSIWASPSDPWNGVGTKRFERFPAQEAEPLHNGRRRPEHVCRPENPVIPEVLGQPPSLVLTRRVTPVMPDFL